MTKTYAAPAAVKSGDVVRDTLSTKAAGPESGSPSKDPAGAAVGFNL
jgi:hypothetical protein